MTGPDSFNYHPAEIRPEESRVPVRYTAGARIWCRVALGLVDARDVYQRGLMTKDGSREALDHFFHQISRPEGTVDLEATHGAASESGAPVQERRPR